MDGIAHTTESELDHQPLRRAYSRQEAIAFATAHIRKVYGKDPDRYCDRLGVAVDLVTEMFPEETEENHGH